MSFKIKLSPISNKEDWDCITNVMAEEDDKVFFAIDTGHQVDNFSVNVSGQKIGTCNQCYQVINFDCKEECIIRIIEFIHYG